MKNKNAKQENSSVDLRLEYTRAKMLYEQLGEGLVSYYAWVLILAVLLFISGVDIEHLIIWLVLYTIGEVASEVTRSRFPSIEQGSDPYLWEWQITGHLFVTTFTISSGVMILLDASNELLLYTSFALIVLPSLMSVGFLVSSMRAQYAWVVGLILPVVVKCAMSDNMYYWVLGAAILLSTFSAAIIFGKKMHVDYVETLKLRFENTDLLNVANVERARAEKASADKMRFLASASHDLRQPIHALELFSDALEHELDKPTQFELMGQIKESTAAMNGLLYSLLDISRLDAGIIKVNKDILMMNDLVEKLIHVIQTQAEEKGIEIVFEAKRCAVVSDAVLLESILHNLLSNAVKYTHKGRVEISCSEPMNGKMKVSILDTGIGISEENKKIIFDEFVQLGNPERDRAQGLGLGLAIVKRTCDLLGHKFAMTSEVGVGSVFSLELDVADIDDVEVQQQVRVSSGQLDVTVLVIDDERIILDGMEQMLSRWGCDVLCAGSLDGALNLLQDTDKQVDLVIADYRLGEGKLGADAVSEIKKVLNKPDMPAMIITGDTGAEQLQNIEGSGFHVLHKPVAAVRVRALMQNLLKAS